MICFGCHRQCLEFVHYMLPAALEYPSVIETVSVCTGLLGKEGCVNISVDTRLITEYPFVFTNILDLLSL